MSGQSFADALNSAGYNVSDHSSFSQTLALVSSILGLVMIFSTILRYVSVAIFMERKFNASDWNMLFALATAIFFGGNNIYGAFHGVGQHIWDVGFLGDPTQFAKLAGNITLTLYGSYILYILASTAVKLSILCNYLNVFAYRTNPKFYTFNCAIVAAVIAMAFASIATLIFECYPAQSSWKWEVPRQHCINIQAFFNFTSVINLTVDVILVFAPLPFFWTINNTRAKRFTICALYSAGLFVCVAGGFRLWYLQGLQSMDPSCNAPDADAQYCLLLIKVYEDTSGRGLTWSAVEVFLGIICANVPSLKPLFDPAWSALKSLVANRVTGVTKIWSKWESYYNMKLKPDIINTFDPYVRKLKRKWRDFTGRYGLPRTNTEASMRWETGCFDKDAIELSTMSKNNHSSTDAQSVDITEARATSMV